MGVSEAKRHELLDEPWPLWGTHKKKRPRRVFFPACGVHRLRPAVARSRRSLAP